MIAFDRKGNGEPPLVFVHGFCCARKDWMAQVAELESRHKCVSLDLPGFGESPPLDSDISMQAFGREILALMDQQALGRAFLIGHSMGCRPIIEMSIVAPKRVAGLVLIDPGRASADYKASKQKFSKCIDAVGFPEHVRTMFSNMFFDLQYDDLKDRLAKRAVLVLADVAVQTYLAMLNWDANRCELAFDSITVPVLVLQSTTRDPGKDRRPLNAGEVAPYQQMILDRVAGAETMSFPGLGHFLMIEAAELVNAQISSFVKSNY